MLKTENDTTFGVNFDKATVRIAKRKSHNPESPDFNLPDFESLQYQQSAVIAANGGNLLTDIGVPGSFVSVLFGQDQILKDGSLSEFQKLNLKLDSWLQGYAGKVWLRFEFDSDDAALNDFPGWNIDDVQLTAGSFHVYDHNGILHGSTSGEQLGLSVSTVGDRNADGKSELGIVSANRVVIVPGGAFLAGASGPLTQNVANTLPIILSSVQTLADMKLLSVGNLNASGPVDFLLTGNDKTILVTNPLLGQNGNPFSGSLESVSTTVNVGPMIALADINGDGFADLGATSLEESSSQNGSTLYHAVGQIHLGPNIASTPNLTIESGEPYYLTLTELPTKKPSLLASIGNWNATVDGLSDFGMVDSNLSRTIRFFSGKRLTPQGGPIGPAAPAVPFVYSYSIPLPLPTSSVLTGINLLQPTANPSTATLPAIEGSASNQQLRDLRPIGDWNGDRYEDFLAISPTRADIILGPYDQNRNNTLEDVSTVSILLGSVAPFRVSLNAADLEPVTTTPGASAPPRNQDGKSDIAFVRELVNQFGSHLLINVLYGNSNPANSISMFNEQSALLIENSPFAGGTASVSLSDRNGDGRWDLVVTGRDRVTLQPRLQAYSYDYNAISQTWAWNTTPFEVQSVQPFVGENLIINGGAETGTTLGWNVRNSFTVASGDAANGTYYFRSPNQISTLTQNVPVSSLARSIDTGNQSFQVTGTLRQSSFRQGALRVSFYNENNGIISGPVTIGTSSGSNWSAVASTITAPPLTRSIRVMLETTSPINVGTVDFDQISLVAVSNPVLLGQTFQDSDGDQLGVVPIGDFNGDGRQDTLITNPFALPSSAVYVSHGLGGSTINTWSVPMGAGYEFGDPRVAGTRAVSLGDFNRDGYSDFAMVNARRDSFTTLEGKNLFAVEDQVMVFAGASTINMSYQAMRTIERGGTLPGTAVTLKPTAGDFDGDGTTDLAILETIRSINTNGTTRTLSSTVYVYWDIGGNNWSSTLNLSQANTSFTSDSIQGILDFINPTPSLDLNRDGVHDLVVGASFGDSAMGTGLLDTGRVFTLYGKPRTTTLPTTGIDTFANRPYPGSGDVLTSSAKGEQQIFDRTISGERWFEFTTVGDGLPGNSIVVTPAPSRLFETVPLAISRAEIPGQYENSPIVFDFDLSNALANAENASQHYSSTGLQFQYDSYPNIPLTGLDLEEKAVVSVLLPDGSTTEVMYFVHGGQLAYTDGTLGNVARVGEPWMQWAMNPSSLRSRGLELFYLSNDVGAGTNRLNVLSGPTDSAVTLYESSPGNQIVQYLLQGDLIVVRTQQGQIVRINRVDQSFVQVPGTYPSISEMAIVGSALYFANSSMFLQALDLTSAADTTPTILQTGWFQSLTESTLDGGTLFFRDGPNLWRSNGTAASTIAIKDVGGPAQSFVDISGSLFFTVNFELWTSDGTANGTFEIAEDSDGHPLLQATSLTSVNGRLYFSGSRTSNRFDVYIADAIGGAFTVQQVAALGIDTSFGVNSEATNFTGVGPLVYFSTRESTSTYLYKMDGTASGASVLSAFGTGNTNGTASHFMSLNGRLGFQLGSLNNEFYLSDGTLSGTKPSREAAFRIGFQKGKSVGYVSEEDATREKYPETLIAIDGYANSNFLPTPIAFSNLSLITFLS